jgi:hypothetical protein
MRFSRIVPAATFMSVLLSFAFAFRVSTM